MISADHLKMLASSGITEEFARARGYETVTDKGRLAALPIHTGETVKIVSTGRRVPGLLIPLLGIDGEVRSYQYRPDNPRLDNDGRVIKYESVFQQPPVLDVPPGVGPLLADPEQTLWFTEGSKKADAAALAGLCCVSLSGVWCWMTKNKAGASMSLPEFRRIPWKGDNGRRRVILAFDGDVACKKSVQKAMQALAQYLAYKGARVEYLWLPDTDDKTGLDDYLAEHSIEELWQLVKPTAPPPRKPGTDPDTSPNHTATPQHPSFEQVHGVARLRRILDAVAAEVQSRGLVGEERLAKTLYLVLTSRLLDNQVSAGVKGHSASGKSYTVETVTRFFPDEAYLEFTAMSERALIYSTEEYAHRTLVVYEITALREGIEDDMTSYFVRSLLSEGRINYEVTVRDRDGGFTTRKITKEGPTNLIFTTTKTRVHAENETRILSLATDDSPEQTARVLLELADETNGNGDLEPWRDFQRWLASPGAAHRVTIPYARQLAQQVAPLAVRLRRDFGSLLALIRAHAMLHQATRQRDDDGRIIAALDDYKVVRELVSDTITEGVGATVSDTVRETVGVVEELGPGVSASGLGVSARAVADKLGVDRSNAGRRLRVAGDGGYLCNLEDRRGKPARWVIGDPLPEIVNLLPDPAQLAIPDTTADLECCGVAPESGECRDTGSPTQHATLDTARDQDCCGVALGSRGDNGDCVGRLDNGDDAQALRLVTDILGAIPTGATDARNGAYLGGLCVDCHTEPHSAGRPRCDDCHSAWLTTIDGHDRSASEMSDLSGPSGTPNPASLPAIPTREDSQ
jgi:Domain of unknown function (DUF3854)